MIKIDLSKAKRLERELKGFANKAYPYATRSAINGYAFKAREIAKETIGNDLLLKNRYTERSIRVNKVTTLNVNSQVAYMGSTNDYMATQQFGGTKTSKGKHGVPLTTSFAAGQTGNNRTKLAVSRNRMKNLVLSKKGSKVGGRRRRNLIAIEQALHTGERVAFLDLGRKKGLFRILGKEPAIRIKMLYDLSHKSVRIPASKWLQKSIDKTLPFMEDIYIKALQFQIDRHGLFR